MIILVGRRNSAFVIKARVGVHQIPMRAFLYRLELSWLPQPFYRGAIGLTRDIDIKVKRGLFMKIWTIPVSWEVADSIQIAALTLDEAIHKIKADDSIALPRGNYVDSSLDVTIDDYDLIREIYNQGQQDEDSSTDGETDGL